uniref:Ribosomal protein L29 n=1 Tax=Climaconeis cf. scalaris TaxID=2846828 RepID=A0A8F8SRT8_9STRA|nr:ribosomal protein L29 [Climaconeis cf. scalaris]QYB19167.1 ribosomal protein L29 [Climaconeis cf. scalaris]
MSKSKFSSISSFSTKEISERVIEIENRLIKLSIKKLTHQDFKSHEIKDLKHQLAQLKTFITIKNLDQQNNIEQNKEF